MKKLLLTTACMACLAFAGCNKQTEPAASENTQTTTATNTANTTAPATTGSMTKDNHEDIRNDLNRLQVLANSKAEAAIDYQDQMMKAVQANNREQVMDIMKKMQGFMTEFNGELKKLSLKSQEVHELRNKFIHSNELGLELTKLSTEAKPDEAKIKELQQQVMDVQKEIMHDVQKLQAKVDPQSAQSAQSAQ
ncbi:viral A-type inclusion protein [Acinetobacter sp. UBA1297]|uniref:viral A-type inclusion protein n=1 Tax=Acinetobacter sp. UBA1297 TaxID=1945925 RepID=UPI00257A49E4|nr:viral A-type inclusion protein [Acinetobacter sp. UBA1297]